MSGGAAAGGAAAAAAARRRRMLHAEEEQMTRYSAEDMDGWEFKIVRSATNTFRNPEKLKRICEEEARSGWELVEKFDNQRLRFKRRTDRRPMDQHAVIDPYRTNIGITEGQLVTVILGIVLIAGAVGIILTMH